jgi:hypothetical protein
MPAECRTRGVAPRARVRLRGRVPGGTLMKQLREVKGSSGLSTLMTRLTPAREAWRWEDLAQFQFQVETAPTTFQFQVETELLC